MIIGYVAQFLSTSLVFFLMNVGLTAFESRSRYADETARVRGRLSRVVAELLDRSNARIMRIAGTGQMDFAQTRVLFPKIAVIVDYSEHQVAGELEDFVIAHELAHYVYHHIWIGIAIQSMLSGLTLSIAVDRSIHRPLFTAALIAIPIILIGTALLVPLFGLMHDIRERSADRFAAMAVGATNACEQMAKLQDLLPKSNSRARKDLDRRIADLRSFASQDRKMTLLTRKKRA